VLLFIYATSEAKGREEDCCNGGPQQAVFIATSWSVSTASGDGTAIPAARSACCGVSFPSGSRRAGDFGRRGGARRGTAPLFSGVTLAAASTSQFLPGGRNATHPSSLLPLPLPSRIPPRCRPPWTR
jgi:hypothetical protein